MRGFSIIAALPLLLMALTTSSPAAERREPPRSRADVPTEARAAGPGLWFAKDDGFDRRFRERFIAAHEAAA